MTYLIPLRDCQDSSIYGGKAHGLSTMIRHGHAIPDGHVIPDIFFKQHLKNCGLEHDVAMLSQLLKNGDITACEALSSNIRSKIIETPLENLFKELVQESYNQNWKGKTLAVRSSAVGEDSAAHSFAGQLDSFLGITSMEALELAMRKTWASIYSPRSMAYQIRKNIILSRMGVIIQEQVDALFSGVLFTRPPTSLADSDMVAEYCKGFGEELVSGKITPGSLLFTREGYIKQHIHPPELESVSINTHLDALKQLAQDAVSLEKLFAAPLDIEWSIDQHGMLRLLQARPITTMPNKANPNQVLWTNANISENFPNPVCPLLYSIAIKGYAAYFSNLGTGFGLSRKRLHAMQDVLDHLIGVHGGRLYYNLTNIHTILQLVPFSKWLMRFFNEFVGASEFPALPSPPMPSLLEKVVETARMPFMIAWKYLTVQKRVERFERTVNEFCGSSPWDQLPNKTIAELRHQFHGFFNIRLRRWNDAALADTSAMITYGLLKLSMKNWLKNNENPNLHNDLLKGLSDISSSTPVIKLWDLSRWVIANPDIFRLINENDPSSISQELHSDKYTDFWERFFDYLDNWGFRGSGELMLTFPTPQEDPIPTISLLKMYVGMEGDSPLALMQQQKNKREEITQSILAEITPSKWLRLFPFSKAWCFKHLLNVAQASIRLRERARFCQARLYVRLRHIAVAMGIYLQRNGKLEMPEDVFFLTAQELDELTAGHAMFPYNMRELIDLRKKSHAELCKSTPPDSFSLNYGEYLKIETRTNDESTLSPATKLSGASASGGYIQSTAKVLNASSEAHMLESGDILVTKQTDPGWASVFFLVKGLVAERGGMLSHGAIIAREYGIPAVVGVTDATKIIQSGKRVAIHGEQGIVEILS